jgi:cbb3-type cytochrome oxidase maturation protein
MTGLLFLIPIAVVMGLLALITFLWARRSGQYEDLEGAGQRILEDQDDKGI